MKGKLHILVVIVVLMQTACNKILDTKPVTEYTTANYYQTTVQLQTALNAAYGTLMVQRLYGQVMGFNFAGSNDELLSNRNADADPRGLRFNFDAGNEYVATIWQYCYVGIQGLNELIDNIDRPVDLDTSSKNKILGQALFLRGFYYFILTTHYGNVPLLLHLPGVTDVNIAATSQADIYRQIEKDMKTAEELLQKEQFTSDKLGYNESATVTAVQAMLARVYLYWAGYPQNNVAKYNDVLTYTQKVMNSGLHELNSDYRQLFKNLSQDRYDIKENIWELGFYSAPGGTNVRGGNDIGNFVGITSNYVVSDTTSWAAASWFWISKKLFDAYEVDPASQATVRSSYDIRRDWNCANYYWSGNPRVKTTVTGPWRMSSGKFRREYCPKASRMNGIYGINWPVIRYADVLLMYAEAENYLHGPTDAAYAALNHVRKRAYGLMNGNVVKSITVTNGGSGYTTVPTVTIEGGGGNGAAAVAQISGGKVTAIYLSSPGDGIPGTAYNTAPTVIINGTGSGASAVATLTDGKEYKAPEGLSKGAFLNYIKEERLRELNAEALRRFDLIRWGNYVQDIKDFTNYALANGIAAVSTSTGGGNPNGLVGIQNISEKHLQLPVPTYELNLNHALTQNPGW